MKKIVKVTILKEDTGYSGSAMVGRDFVGTQAETVNELKNSFLEAAQLSVGPKNTVGLRYAYDLESFFTNYRVINAKALSKRIGMNQSLLSQYIKGKRKASEAQKLKILAGVQEIGKELAELEFA